MSIKNRISKIKKTMALYSADSRLEVCVSMPGESSDDCLKRYGLYGYEDDGLYVILVKFCQSNPEKVKERERKAAELLKEEPTDTKIENIISELQDDGLSMEQIASKINNKSNMLDLEPTRFEVAGLNSRRIH